MSGFYRERAKWFRRFVGLAALFLFGLHPSIVSAVPTLLWNASHSQSDAVNSVPGVLREAEDHTMLISGYIETAYGAPGFICKLDVWGNRIWYRQWGGSQSVVVISDVAVGSTNYFFCGSGSGPFVYAVDRDGEELWQFHPYTSVSDGFNGYCYAVCAMPDGGCAMALSKRIMHPFFRIDPAIIRLDSGGDTLWCRTYPISPHNRVNLTDMVTTDDGGLLAVGWYENILDSIQYSRLLILKVMDDGTLLWYRLFGEGDESFLDPAIFPQDNGYVIACHRIVGLGGPDQTRLFKIDLSGDTTWTYIFDFYGPMTYVHNSSDSALVLVNMYDYVVKFDFNDNLVWAVQSNLQSIFYEDHFIIATEDGGFLAAGSIPGGYAVGRLSPEDGSLPAAFIPQVQFMPNYPNPCNATTIVPVWLAKPASAKIQLYDILGREIGTVWEGMLSGGVNRVMVKVSSLSSGNYFCKVNAVNETNYTRITVVR